METGDWATWVGSVGIVLTLVATLLALERERRIRRADEQTRIAEQVQRQAELISGWLTSTDYAPGLRSVALNNASSSVMYELIVYVAIVEGEGRSAITNVITSAVCVDVLPPGKWEVGISLPGGQPPGRLGIEFAFTDQAGRHWIRQANGSLQRLTESPMVHFNLAPPILYTSVRAR